MDSPTSEGSDLVVGDPQNGHNAVWDGGADRAVASIALARAIRAHRGVHSGINPENEPAA